MTWTPTKEAFPPYGELVSVYVPSNIKHRRFLATYRAELRCWVVAPTGVTIPRCKVTHWEELGEMP